VSIAFSCPKCGAQLVAKESRAGQQKTCPKCRSSVTVPAADAVAARDELEDHEFLLMPSERKKHEDLIDMTAMVDIVFFLLIFFMVTSIQALESVIDLPTPQSTDAAASATAVAEESSDASLINVTIEADDTVWVEDQQVFGRQDLRVKLRDEGPHASGLMIVGHPEASHGQLVMVLDAGADAGLHDLRFSINEDTGGPSE
jgi:biopolymer transport protein ExbD